MSRRIALVTGGTRGIGATIAETLKEQGYQVIANYFGNHDTANIFQQKTGIAVRHWDVSDFEGCQKGVQDIEAQFGPVDVLVNNAGITRDGFLHKMTADQWNDVIRTNLSSCFNMSRAMVEGMRTRGFGRIISISSVNGVKGQIGQTNYAAAKAGIIGFTKALALENAAKGVTVNAIAPGYIDTEMLQSIAPDVLQKIVDQIPVKRLGVTTEIARTVLFLASDDAGYITGATMHINGGLYLV